MDILSKVMLKDINWRSHVISSCLTIGTSVTEEESGKEKLTAYPLKVRLAVKEERP